MTDWLMLLCCHCEGPADSGGHQRRIGRVWQLHGLQFATQALEAVSMAKAGMDGPPSLDAGKIYR